jgi:hypothetical protein
MKQAFLIAFIASLALAGVLWWSGTNAGNPDAGNPRVRAGGKAILDPRTASGRDLFVPDLAPCTVDDEELSYPAWLFFCAALEPVDGERIRMERLRVLQNPRPQRREDLEKLVRFPEDSAPAPLGETLERFISTSHAGLVADHAELVGGHTMLSARRVDLKGRALLARMSAGVRETVNSTDLALEFDQGQLVHARASTDVEIDGALFALKSRGLDFDARSGQVELLRDVSGHSKTPLLDAAGTAPFHFASTGLVRFTPDKAPTTERVLPEGGTLHAAGAVEAREGSSAMRSAELELAFGGQPSRVQRLALGGQVEAQLPVFSAHAERLTMDAGTGVVEAAGSPLALRWNDPEALIHLVEADGLVKVSRTATADVMTLDARETARMSGAAIALAGSSLHALLERGVGNQMRPREVSARNVSGRFGAMELAAGGLTLATQGGLRELVLREAPRLLLRMPEGLGRGAALLGVAENIPLVLRVECAGALTLLMDPLREQPGTLQAEDAVRLSVHQGDERGPVLARLHSNSLKLRFSERHARETLGGVRYTHTTQIDSATATGAVLVERGAISGHAELLGLDFLQRNVVFRGAPARLELPTESGAAQWCAATELNLAVGTRTLRIIGPWQGALLLPALTRASGKPAVLTDVRGHGGLLTFNATGRELACLEHMEQVQLQQAAGGSARADAVEFVVEPQRFVARGNVHLELASAQGAPESVTAPLVQWFGEALLAEGPLRAALNAPPLRLSGRTAAAKAGLLEISCAGSLASQGGVLVLEGPLSAKQMLDSARPVELSGRRALVFVNTLVPGSALERLVIEGDVLCHTEDMDVRGALLRADIPDRRMLLSGGAEPCVLSLSAAGLRDHRRPAFLVDFTDPDNPVVESVDRTIPPEPR